MTTVAVIGAGIAGLACARALAAGGMRPVVFDKGRGIGGRVATRRGAGGQFDHGAQYVTARGHGFVSALAALGEAAGRWDDGTGRARIVGVPGMSALARTLGAGLEVRQGVTVTSVQRGGAGWLVAQEDGVFAADRVVLTVPAPQVAALIGADHPLVTHLAPVRMDPCLTLMAAVAAPAPFVTRSEPDDPLAWIAQDSAKPGRPVADAVAWVAQADLAFSAAHLEEDAGAIAAQMVPMLCDRIGAPVAAVRHAAAHRWRYARVAVPLGAPFLRAGCGTLHLAGDWCLGARVEAAWDSGTAAAEDILGGAS